MRSLINTEGVLGTQTETAFKKPLATHVYPWVTLLLFSAEIAPSLSHWFHGSHPSTASNMPCRPRCNYVSVCKKGERGNKIHGSVRAGARTGAPLPPSFFWLLRSLGHLSLSFCGRNVAILRSSRRTYFSHSPTCLGLQNMTSAFFDLFFSVRNLCNEWGFMIQRRNWKKAKQERGT